MRGFWFAVVTAVTLSPATTLHAGSLHPHRSWHTDAPRVVLVHGFGSRATSLQPLATELADAGYAVATFQYDCRLGVRGAAQSLVDHLTTQEKFDPAPVSIVTHSMGGLVVRWALEQTDWTPTNVQRLIMIAPPNGGSAIATLSAQSLVDRSGDSESLTPKAKQQIARMDRTLSELLGAAVGDLRPDSEVLRRLSKANRNPQVDYSILAGSEGPLPPETAEIGPLLNLTLSMAAATVPRGRRSPDRGTQQAERMLRAAGNWLEFAGSPEWTRGQGDGVVSIASTKLSGVDDHEVLPVRHNTLTSDLQSLGGRLLLRAIQNRLPSK